MTLTGLKIAADDRRFIAKNSANLRKEAVDEAISWAGGTIENKRMYRICEYLNFEVLLGKPGKEAPPEYNRCKYKGGGSGNNPNDMTPILLRNGVRYESPFGFDDIFQMLFGITSRRVLEILGAVLFRMSYMLDHKTDSQGHLRLAIDESILDFLERECPVVRDIPIRIFIAMLEAISLNEDVKYHTLGYNDVFGNGAGRRNNLLTYVRLIAVHLKKESMWAFIGSFARPPVGISSISNVKAFEIFPDLN